MCGSNLAQATTNNFRAIPGMKLLSCLSLFFCDNFQEKELSSNYINVLFWRLKEFLAATVYQESHF